MENSHHRRVKDVELSSQDREQDSTIASEGYSPKPVSRPLPETPHSSARQLSLPLEPRVAIESRAEIEARAAIPVSSSQRQSLARRNIASRQPLKQWTIISLGAIALGFGLVIGLPRLGLDFFRGNTASITDLATDNLLTVATIRLEPDSSYQVIRTYTGEVASLRSSDLGFERSGTLEWVGVNRGDRVRRGASVARLDTRNLAAQRTQLVAQRDQSMALLSELQKGPRQEDIDAAQATVRDLEDQLELQRIRQQRREFLADEGAISREQLDEVAFGADALEERLTAARSDVQELLAGTRPEQIAAQEAAVAQLDGRIKDLDITIEKSTIKAPFDGIIGERQQDEGTVVGAGQAVVRVVEAAQPEVEIGIPGNNLKLLPVGSAHSVTIGSDRYTATVQSTLPEVDPTTRTRIVVLRLSGVDSTIVAPGQIARLELQNSVSESGYWLPTTALVQGDKGLWNAYAVVSDESSSDATEVYQVERRVIDVLHTEGDRVFVQGTLQPGDRLISDGVQRVVPGQRVQVADD